MILGHYLECIEAFYEKNQEIFTTEKDFMIRIRAIAERGIISTEKLIQIMGKKRFILFLNQMSTVEMKEIAKNSYEKNNRPY